MEVLEGLTRRRRSRAAATIDRLDPQLMPRLPAHVLAQFEAVSGLMVVNVDRNTLTAASRRLDDPDEGSLKLFAAINHEMYHYFQVIATGYHFLHVSQMGRIIFAIAAAGPIRRWRKRLEHGGMRVAKRLVGRSELGERMLGWTTVIQEHNELLRLEANAPQDDPSLAVARAPRLFRALEAHNARLRAANAEGLSALDLIEGSALVYQYALTYAGTPWREQMAADWPQWDETYRRAYGIAQERCGPRAADVLLPAVALALRYENPPEAFGVFLDELADAPPGDEIAAARVLAERPPRIRAAGRHLGTACDVRRRQRFRRRRYRAYDAVLGELRQRAWGVDEIDLLAAPQAAGGVPVFPFGVVASDGPVPGPGGGAEVLARMLVASIVLKTASLPREQRDANRRLAAHALRGAHYLFGPYTPAKRAFERGVRRTEDGDAVGACAAFREAMESGDPELAPRAAYNLGILLVQQGDLVAARDPLERATDSGHAEVSPIAAFNLGVLLADLGDVPAAIIAYQRAIDSGDAEQAPKAADNLGSLLSGQGDAASAQMAYQRAIDTGHPYFAQTATLHLGRLLAEQGDVEGARAALQRAIDSGHPDVAPKAAAWLGYLLANQGDFDGMRVAFQRAVGTDVEARERAQAAPHEPS